MCVGGGGGGGQRLRDMREFGGCARISMFGVFGVLALVFGVMCVCACVINGRVSDSGGGKGFNSQPYRINDKRIYHFGARQQRT